MGQMIHGAENLQQVNRGQSSGSIKYVLLILRTIKPYIPFFVPFYYYGWFSASKKKVEKNAGKIQKTLPSSQSQPNKVCFSVFAHQLFLLISQCLNTKCEVIGGCRDTGFIPLKVQHVSSCNAYKSVLWAEDTPGHQREPRFKLSTDTDSFFQLLPLSPSLWYQLDTNTNVFIVFPSLKVSLTVQMGNRGTVAETE